MRLVLADGEKVAGNDVQLIGRTCTSTTNTFILRKPHSGVECLVIIYSELDVVLCYSCYIPTSPIHRFASPTSSPQRLLEISNTPQAAQRSNYGILECEQKAQGHSGRLRQLVRSSVYIFR